MLKKKITRTRKPVTDDERSFILAMIPLAKLGEIAEVIGRKLSVIQSLKAKHKIQDRPTDRAPLSLAGLRQAYSRYMAGDRLDQVQAVKFWRDDFDQRGRMWSFADEQELIELLGTIPKSRIAKELNRDREHVSRRVGKLRKDGRLKHHGEFPVNYLARQVGSTSYTLQVLIGEFKLRSYRDGGRVYVHRDDALALLDMPFPLDSKAVTKHPGKTRETLVEVKVSPLENYA